MGTKQIAQAIAATLIALTSPFPACADRQARPQRATIFALLADNRLLAVRLSTGRVLAIHRFGPGPVLPVEAQYLALSQDRRLLYALVPGRADAATRLIVVDTQSAHVRASYLRSLGPPYPKGSATLTVGPQTGNLYLISDDAQSTAVHILDPNTGAVLRQWAVSGISGQILNAVISPDERTLFVSYHGPGTAVLALPGGSPHSCCWQTHGFVAMYGDTLIAATGNEPVLQLDMSGKTVRTFSSRLPGNHLMDFAPDMAHHALYIVGPCGYTGGFSRVDLQTGATRVLVRSGPYNLICGEPQAAGPGPTVVVGFTGGVTIVQRLPGVLLVLSGRTGKVLRRIQTSADPVSVAIAG
jgi:hypothetical protein